MNCINDASWILNTNTLNSNRSTFPIPYFPPVQPVLSNQTLTLCSFIFLRSKSAYAWGFKGKNASPKHAENVGVGSLIPC